MDPNEKTDSDIAIALYVRLNTALMALEEAQSITPQRNPFREIDDGLRLAIATVRLACGKCEDL